MTIKLNGLEVNLTSEQVEELKRQLEVKEETLPTTWEEAFDMVLPCHYIESSGYFFILRCKKGEYNITKNHVPSEKHAKSVLAMCKLMTIAEAYNQSVDGELEYMIDKNFFNELYVYDGNYLGNPILFKKEEHAKHCLKHFMDLWNDFFMI